MAQTRGQLAAQKKAQASAPKERENQPSSTRTHRRRARGHQGQTTPERAESLHSPPPNIVLYQKTPPTSLEHTGQRRLRTAEDLLDPTLNEPPRKRRRPSYPVEETSGQETVHHDTDNRAGPIGFWIRENKWPPGYSQQSLMEHLLARKRSSSRLGRKRSEAGSAAPSSTTPSETLPLETLLLETLPLALCGDSNQSVTLYSDQNLALSIALCGNQSIRPRKNQSARALPALVRKVQYILSTPAAGRAARKPTVL